MSELALGIATIALAAVLITGLLWWRERPGFIPGAIIVGAGAGLGGAVYLLMYRVALGIPR